MAGLMSPRLADYPHPPPTHTTIPSFPVRCYREEPLVALLC